MVHYFEFKLLNQLMKWPYGRCWEAGSTQGHASLECIKLEFLHFISHFNNQDVSNSTSSIQEYMEKYWHLKIICAHLLSSSAKTVLILLKTWLVQLLLEHMHWKLLERKKLTPQCPKTTKNKLTALDSTVFSAVRAKDLRIRKHKYKKF